MVWNYYTICTIVHKHSCAPYIYTPALAVRGISWTSSCVHLPPLSVYWWRFSAWLRHGQTSVGGGEEWGRDDGSTLALVWQNIVQALCTHAEAVKQQIIHAKHLCCASGSIPPLDFRFSERASAGYPHFSTLWKEKGFFNQAAVTSIAF